MNRTLAVFIILFGMVLCALSARAIQTANLPASESGFSFYTSDRPLSLRLLVGAEFVGGVACVVYGFVQARKKR